MRPAFGTTPCLNNGHPFRIRPRPGSAGIPAEPVSASRAADETGISGPINSGGKIGNEHNVCDCSDNRKECKTFSNACPRNHESVEQQASQVENVKQQRRLMAPLVFPERDEFITIGHLRIGVHSFTERPRLSDPAHKTCGLQPDRDGRVRRCSAWLANQPLPRRSNDPRS